MTRASLLFSILSIAAFTACEGGGGDDATDDSIDEDDTSSDDSNATDDSADDSPVGDTSGTIRGTVSVQLYDDSSGERQFVEWANAGYTSFPFGRIFVAAYHERSEADGGGRSFDGDTTVISPSLAGDPYEIHADIEGGNTVTVYAQLDYYVDRVLGTNDPVGFHAWDVVVPNNGTVEGVDITILAPLPSTSSGGGPGGGGCSTVSVSGEVIITLSYAGGQVATFFQDLSGNGPYEVAWWDPSPTGGGATNGYGHTVCADAGQWRLRGAWDNNGNELIDPTDRWGGYSAGNDGDGNPLDSNPITIGSVDLTNYNIAIPLGTEEGFALVPFTALSGTLSMANGGTFDTELAANTTVYVTALKYNPSQDMAVSQLEPYSYSLDTMTWAELQGHAEVGYSMPVPGNTIAYLWAFADEDNDGIINESGEAVASAYGSATGRVPVGSEGASGIDLSMGRPEE